MHRQGFVHRQVGRRGAFLLLFGFIYAAFGLRVLTIAPTELQLHGLVLLTRWVPYHSVGWLWIAAAAVAVSFAFHEGPTSDRWGFYALMLPATVWAGAYIGAGFLQHDLAIASSAISTLAFAVIVGIVSGWRENGQ